MHCPPRPANEVTTATHRQQQPRRERYAFSRVNTRGSVGLVRRVSVVIGATLALVTLATTSAQAQAEYPNRPVRMLVGGPPASSGDIGARLLASKLSERLGQPFIVENKPGATGALAAGEVARAEPDGYTLLFTASWHSTAAAVKKSLPYDPLTDFSFVSTLMTYGMLVAVHPSSPHQRIEELIAFGKANPGKLTFYSVGAGSAHHLIGEWFNALTGAEMVHVPYKGSPAAFVDFSTGRVDVMIDTMTFGLTQVKGGKARALAITSREPMEQLPGVPTISRALAEMEYESWLGLLAPRNMNPTLLERINRAMREAIQLPDTSARIRDFGATPAPVTSAEFRARCEREIARFKSIVAARKIPME